MLRPRPDPVRSWSHRARPIACAIAQAKPGRALIAQGDELENILPCFTYKTRPRMTMRARSLAVLVNLCLFVCADLHAQKQANVWHFGVGRSIDFSSGTPVSVPGGQMNTYEGCASYSDRCGNLLFYTNGGGLQDPIFGDESGRIWTSANTVMYDMNYIQGGGNSAAQSSVIVEAPGQDSVYYLFTMEDFEGSNSGNGLSYFTIDMGLNGGLGGVVEADQLVYASSLEGLCAVRHANKRDFWIIIYDEGVGLRVYGLDPSGISFSSSYDGPPGAFIIAGYTIKATPDGAHIMVSFQDSAAYSTDKYLLDFDNSTGQISDPILIDPTLPNGDFLYYEFSHNSRYLYTLQYDSITPFPLSSSVIQYDLQASDINASAANLGSYSINGYFSNLQLGPDGNIYFIGNATDSDLFNSPLFLCRIECPNTAAPSVQLDVLDIYSNNSFFIGLPNFPAWLFESSGDQYVSLGPDTLRICEGCGPLDLDALNPGATYLWSTGATTRSITVSAPGTYSVTVTGSCGSGTDQIVVLPCCTFPDTTILVSQCDPYTAPWGTTYTESGTYTDTITTIYGCDSIVTVQLTIASDPQLGITVDGLDAPGTFCVFTDDPVQLNASGAVTYSWSPASGLSCTDCPAPLASPAQSTLYTVTGPGPSGCPGTAQIQLIICDSIYGLCEVQVPNVFTPNSDGNNDVFSPLIDCTLKNYEFSVFDRWGDLLFKTSRQDEKWNGKYKGVGCPDGVYFYVVNYQVPTFPMGSKHGSLTLLR